MFDILHVLCNGPSTLLRIGKILAMDHDLSAGGRGICLLEGGPYSLRCGGGGEKLNEHGRYRYDNCIKKQLILLELESGFGEGEAVSDRIIVTGGHNFEPSTNPSKVYPNKRDVNCSSHAE